MMVRLSKRVVDAAVKGPTDQFLWDQSREGFLSEVEIARLGQALGQAEGKGTGG